MFEMESSPTASVAAYRHSLRSRLHDVTPISAGISSVVPGLTSVIAQAVRDDFMIVPTIVDSKLELPFAVDYDPPESLGADRLCAAAAACAKLELSGPDAAASVIVVDAGTAVTYDVVEGGCYRGGAIAPGPQMAISALDRGTAMLHVVELSVPKKALANDTTDGIRSGVVFGFVDSVSAMIKRLAAEIESTPVVFATGGWGSFLAEHVDAIDSYEPNLVLEGVWLLASESQV
jgi:type III pantothenate kinase